MSTIGIVRADFFRLFQDFDRVIGPFLGIEFIGLADQRRNILAVCDSGERQGANRRGDEENSHCYDHGG